MRPRLQPAQHGGDGQLDDPARLVVSQRPQHDQGRLRPEGEVEGEQRDLLARLDLLDPLPEHGLASCRGRVGAVVQKATLDAVGVRVPALPEDQLQLPLGHLRARGQSELGQTGPPPPPGRKAGHLLGVPQRLAGRTAAVPERDSAHVVSPRITPLNLRDTQHPTTGHQL
ncbi:hypothetical protein GCM10010236_10600 [Streptomyces eurythermus]|nr:hypothetical protein GCM10010236_10600 [Streptomyces eurythermus]